MTDESDDFDACDPPDEAVQRPGRRFDLSEDEATRVARQLAELDGVYDITRCVGGSQSGRTDSAYSVNFALSLSTGHLVRAEIHDSAETVAAAYDGVSLSSLDTLEHADETLEDLRTIAEVESDP